MPETAQNRRITVASCAVSWVNCSCHRFDEREADMPERRHALAQRRTTVGLSQERLAEAVGVDRSTVVRWERAKTAPQPWHRPKLAAALRISVEELAELLAPVPVRALAPRPASATAAGDIAAECGDDLDAVRWFRLADRQVGGAHLYARLTGYLRHAVAPRMFGQTLDHDGTRVFAAAASLTEMAGWMAHDAGHDQLARQHFQQASSLAVAGRDDQLAAHVFGSLSHLALHLRRPKDAIVYACRGQERLDRVARHSGLQARLLALRARGHAAVADSAACREDLRGAERMLEGVPSPASSPWANGYDAASLAVDTARCLCQLGAHEAARTHVEQVIKIRPPDRVRSRALAQLILVSILIAQHRPEEACDVTRHVLTATTTLGSAQVFRQMQAIGLGLAPYRGSRRVAEFVDHLHGELEVRRWMTRRLSVVEDRADTGSL
jgi:transcriptional regulator with XRE-family HTH domain